MSAVVSGSISVSMTEWQTYHPAQDQRLQGLTLGGDPALERLAEQLSRYRQLEVLELARGLRLTAFQFVGRLQLGNLAVTIQPKLTGAPLMRLLRHAYGLRDLTLLDDTAVGNMPETFIELLIHQLVAEAEELLARGLHRRYVREEDNLSNPRGRIDLQRLARQQPGLATLPCTLYSRRDDNILNRVLLAGLTLAGRLSTDIPLRSRARRLASLMSESVRLQTLDPGMLALAEARLDRLTTAYRPALTLIRLLLGGAGSALEGESPQTALPGFLFDMSRFFQALLFSFLSAHLHAHQVQAEWRLDDFLRYVPGLNPRGAVSPTPRPDFAIFLQGHHGRQGRLVALLDAKYRDLWTTSLPREMLYQLSLYAVSQGMGGKATILYPTLDAAAREAAIQLRQPGTGSELARVMLRPVDLHHLDRLLNATGTAAAREREQYAHWLAFGG